MKNITVKTTFTAIAALFFATSLLCDRYGIQWDVNDKSSHAYDQRVDPMQNDKMAVLCSSCTKV